MEVLPHLGGDPAPAIGDVLAGYRLESELGRGGMGVVYRARHQRLQREVALKVLAPHLASDESFRQRFIRESQAAAALRHPHIVTVHDAGEARGHLFLALEYIDGTDLARAIEGAPLEPSRAITLLAQVASALDAAHAAGIVHRDVKPANVLLAGDRAYLTDFGLASRATDRTRLTAVGQVAGTTDYLAPEQVEGRPFDTRTDVYALGCVLHHCLTGRPPFQRDSDVQVLLAHLNARPPSVRTVRPELPAAIDDVVARALAKEPDARFPTCAALVEAARAALSGGEEVTTPGRPRILTAVRGTSRSLIRAGLQREAGVDVEELSPDGSVVAVARALRPAVLLVEAGPDHPFGPQECQELTGEERTAATRIIPVVPRGERALGQQLLAAGAYDVLVTPFSVMQLIVKVREAMAGADVQSR